MDRFVPAFLIQICRQIWKHYWPIIGLTSKTIDPRAHAAEVFLVSGCCTTLLDRMFCMGTTQHSPLHWRIQHTARRICIHLHSLLSESLAWLSTLQWLCVPPSLDFKQFSCLLCYHSTVNMRVRLTVLLGEGFTSRSVSYSMYIGSLCGHIA